MAKQSTIAMGAPKKRNIDKGMRGDPFFNHQDYYIHQIPNPLIHNPEYFKKWYKSENSNKNKKRKENENTNWH